MFFPHLFGAVRTMRFFALGRGIDNLYFLFTEFAFHFAFHVSLVVSGKKFYVVGVFLFAPFFLVLPYLYGF